MANNQVIEYSPTAAKTYRFCQKKFYFLWLSRKKQGWRKTPEHPWHQVHLLRQVKHPQNWAGDLYHQVMARTLNDILSRKTFNEGVTRHLAQEIASAQYRFSSEKRFLGAVKSRTETLQGISTYLALFEHVYDQPGNSVLQNTQDKLDLWLSNTFTWGGWSDLINRIRIARTVYIEPQNLLYEISGGRIGARMDIGIETAGSHFILYDWKCYSEDERFTEYNQASFKQQLLTYALWPVRRDRMPLSIDRIVANIYNPINNEHQEVRFTEEDHADFELEADRWVRIQSRLFTDISEVEFDDLQGPYDPGRSCPWCPFKAVCGKEITWHSLT